MTINVSIVGLGLIGGSLGLALKRNRNVQVTGFDNSYGAMQEAYRRGIIDIIAPSIHKVSENADVIIFATPVNTTVRLLQEVPKWQLKENVIISDTGSTKEPIMRAAENLRKLGITFIGGHPMTGSHKSGVTAAREHLFENAYYILTPASLVKKEQIEMMKNLLVPTKGKIVVLNAQEHDQMTAIVSHFPHLIASSLVGRLSEQQESQPFVRELAAGGFRDLTRIASADPVMWRDITIQNKDELLAQLDGWVHEMERIRQMLLRNNPEEIESFFSDAKHFRDELPISKGALFTTYDLHIDIPDHPGIISEITKILAEERISITNIRIVETRTDVFGILVISFQTIADRRKAQIALSEETTYSTQIV